MQVQRLGHGAGLVALAADALVGRLGAITGGHGLRAAIALLACGRQRRPHEVEIQVVDRQRVGPLVAMALQQRVGQLRHAGGALGDGAVLEAQHRATTALLDDRFHGARLVDRDRVLRVGEDHHAGLATRIHHGGQSSRFGHVVGGGGDVREQARGRVRPGLLARVPAHQRHTRCGRVGEGHLLFGGVKATHHDAGRLERQRLVQRGGASADAALPVHHTHVPADRLASLFDALGHPQNAAVFQVGGDEDDGLARHRFGAGGGAIPSFFGHGGDRHLLSGFFQKAVGAGLAGEAGGHDGQGHGAQAEFAKCHRCLLVW